MSGRVGQANPREVGAFRYGTAAPVVRVLPNSDGETIGDARARERTEGRVEEDLGGRPGRRRADAASVISVANRERRTRLVGGPDREAVDSDASAARVLVEVEADLVDQADPARAEADVGLCDGTGREGEHREVDVVPAGVHHDVLRRLVAVGVHDVPLESGDHSAPGFVGEPEAAAVPDPGAGPVVDVGGERGTHREHDRRVVRGAAATERTAGVRDAVEVVDSGDVRAVIEGPGLTPNGRRVVLATGAIGVDHHRYRLGRTVAQWAEPAAVAGDAHPVELEAAALIWPGHDEHGVDVQSGWQRDRVVVPPGGREEVEVCGTAAHRAAAGEELDSADAWRRWFVQSERERAVRVGVDRPQPGAAAPLQRFVAVMRRAEQHTAGGPGLIKAQHPADDRAGGPGRFGTGLDVPVLGVGEVPGVAELFRGVVGRPCPPAGHRGDWRSRGDERERGGEERDCEQ